MRETLLLSSGDVSTAFQSGAFDQVTLLTCEGYDSLTGEYHLRRAVKAVLVDVQNNPSPR